MLVGLCVFTEMTNAQKYISMEKAVEIAQSNNSNVKMSQWDEKVSNADYRQTDASFLPQVNLEYSALGTNNPLNAFGFLLNQSTVTSADFDPSSLNHPGFSHNFGTKIEVKQPIFNPDMTYARKGAKAQEEAYKLGSVRTRQHIIFEVKKAYSQLQFSYRAKELLTTSLEEIKTISQSVENFQKQGLVQKSDVLNSRVQVNIIEVALARAESNIQNASEGLSLLMGDKKQDVVFVPDSLALQPMVFKGNELDLTRPDIQMLDKSIESMGMMTKSVHMQAMPKLNAFGSYQLNDTRALGFRADSYLVGVAVSWNIFSGNANHSKYKSYQFKKEKMTEEKNLYVRQSQLEIDKTQREMHDILVEIKKDESSMSQADEALRILQNRFKAGLSNTTDLLTAQAQSSQQRLLLSQAVMNYDITAYYLDFLLAK